MPLFSVLCERSLPSLLWCRLLFMLPESHGVVPLSPSECPRLLGWSRSFHSPGSHPDGHVLLPHQGLLFAKQGWRGIPLLSVLGFVFQWPWLRSLKLSCLRLGTESWGGMLQAREQTLCCKGCIQLRAEQANRVLRVLQHVPFGRTLSTSGRSNFWILESNHGSV